MSSSYSWSLPIQFLLATHFLFRSTCQGVVQCVCTTTECKRDRKSTCVANSLCYEQRMNDDGTPVEELAGRRSMVEEVHHGSSFDLKSTNSGVVRGCIDDNTPLLCRNQKPSWFSGAWPVLRCCSEDWCNRPRAAAETGSGSFIRDDEEKEEEEDEYYDEEEGGNSQIKGGKSSADLKELQKKIGNGNQPCLSLSENGQCLDNDHRQPSTRLMLLYIAVPVSGACALSVICAIAFVILRRGREERRMPTPDDELYGCPKHLSRNVLRLKRTTNHQNNKRTAFDWKMTNRRHRQRTSRVYIESRIFTA